VSRLAAVREQLPEAARQLAQLVADNPGQMAVLASGAYLSGAMAARIVRPRNLAEALALILVLDTAISWALPRLLESGVIRLRVRDAAGNADSAA